MTMSTTATFTMTMAELKFADSLIPMTMRMVTATVINTAGRLRIAASLHPAAWIAPGRAEATDAGMSMPRNPCRKLTR